MSCEAPPKAARPATQSADPPPATSVRATISPAASSATDKRSPTPQQQPAAAVPSSATATTTATPTAAPTAHVAQAEMALSPETQPTSADATSTSATAALPVEVIAHSAATAQLQAASIAACHPVSAKQAAATKAAAVLATTASPAFVSAFAKAATPRGSSTPAAAPTPSAVTKTAAASIQAASTSASVNVEPRNTPFPQVPTPAAAEDALSAPPQPVGAAYQPHLLPQPVEAATETTSPAPTTAESDCVNATGTVANTAVASSRAMFAAAPRSGSHLQATTTAHSAHAPVAESRPPRPLIQPPIATATTTAMLCAPREPEPATDTLMLPATATSKLISSTPAGSSIDSSSQTEREPAFGNTGAERQPTAAMPSAAAESTAAAVANAPAKAAPGNRSSLLPAMPTIAAESPLPPQLAGETRQSDLMPQPTVTSTATSVTLIVPRDMPSSTTASSSSAPLQRKQKLKPVSEAVSKQVPSIAEAATNAAHGTTSIAKVSAALKAATPDSATHTKSSSEQAGPSIINAPSLQPRATAASTTAVYQQTESDSAAVNPSSAAVPTTEPQVEQASTPASAAAMMATPDATRFTTAATPSDPAVLTATSSMSLPQNSSPAESISSESSNAASLDWALDRNEADSASNHDQQQTVQGVTPWDTFRQQIIEATREAAGIELQVCLARRSAALAEFAYWEAKSIQLRSSENKQNDSNQPSKQASKPAAPKTNKLCWNCRIRGHLQRDCRQPPQQPPCNISTSMPPAVQCWSGGRYGHFSRECRSHPQSPQQPSSSRRSHQRDQQSSRYASAHQVVARRHTNAIFCVDGQPLLITVQINDVSVQALVDTGSSVSLISGEIAQAIPGLSDTLTTSDIPATMTVAGEPLELMGQISGDITIDSTTFPFSAQVCAKLQCQILLGTDILLRFGPTAIDIARGEVIFGCHNFPVNNATNAVGKPEDEATAMHARRGDKPTFTSGPVAVTAQHPDFLQQPHPPKLSRRQLRAEASKDSKFCWKCDIIGHFVRECPQRQPMQAVINQPVCPVYLIVQQPPPTATADANVNVVYQSTSIERSVDQQTAISSASAETQCSLQEFASHAPAAPQALCQPLSLRVKLNGIEVIAIVDIGSAISLIDQGFVQQNPCVADNNNQWVPDFLATTCEVQQHAGFTGYIYTALAIGSRAEQVSINVYRCLPCQLLLGTDMLQLFQPIVMDCVRSHAYVSDVKVPLLNEFEPGLASYRVSLKDATEFQAKQDLIVFAKIERLFDITVQERLSDRITTNGYGFFEGMSAFASHHPINALSALVPSTNGEVPVRLINTTDAVAQLQGGAHLGTCSPSASVTP